MRTQQGANLQYKFASANRWNRLNTWWPIWVVNSLWNRNCDELQTVGNHLLMSASLMGPVIDWNTRVRFWLQSSREVKRSRKEIIPHPINQAWIKASASGLQNSSRVEVVNLAQMPSCNLLSAARFRNLRDTKAMWDERFFTCLICFVKNTRDCRVKIWQNNEYIFVNSKWHGIQASWHTLKESNEAEAEAHFS